MFRVSAILLFVVLALPDSVGAQAACPTPWKLVETLKIGSADGRDALAEVLAFDIGPDGRIYVAQLSTPYIAVFDPRGRPAGTIGRAGQGPGEITMWVDRMRWQGDTLWAIDLNRTHLFTPDGKPAGEVSFKSAAFPSEASTFLGGLPLADGSILGRRSLYADLGTSMAGFFDAKALPLRRFSRTGAVLDTIVMVQLPISRRVKVPGAGAGAILNPFTFWYAEEWLPVVVTADNSAVILLGGARIEKPAPTLFNLGGLLGRPAGSFDLLRIGIRGDTLLKASIPYEPKALTEPLRKWLDDAFAAHQAGDFTPDSPMYLMKPQGAEGERRRAAARGACRCPSSFLRCVKLSQVRTERSGCYGNSVRTTRTYGKSTMVRGDSRARF
jgi:hypothetical protein